MWQVISLFLLASYYTFLKDSPFVAVIALLLYVGCYQVQESTFLFLFLFFFEVCSCICDSYNLQYFLKVLLFNIKCAWILQFSAAAAVMIIIIIILSFQLSPFTNLPFHICASMIPIWSEYKPRDQLTSMSTIGREICKPILCAYKFRTIFCFFYLAWVSSKMCLNHYCHGYSQMHCLIFDWVQFWLLCFYNPSHREHFLQKKKKLFLLSISWIQFTYLGLLF